MSLSLQAFNHDLFRDDQTTSTEGSVTPLETDVDRRQRPSLKLDLCKLKSRCPRKRIQIEPTSMATTE